VRYHFFAQYTERKNIFWLTILYNTPIAIHARTRRKMSF